MNCSESISALSIALCKAQGEFEHAHKNATNPHFKNRYADLTEVIDTVRPILAKYELSVIQFPGYVDGVTTLETVLLHVSGEWISGTAGARMQKDDPQGVGSALTYLRRYSLAAVCGISQDDDDGEHASKPDPRALTLGTPAPATPHEQPMSKQVGSARDTFSLDTVAGSPQSKAKGRSWRELLTTDEGRGYVRWCVDKQTTMAPNARAALTEALQAQKADGGEVVVLQDLVNRAASLGVIDQEHVSRIEASIARADVDELRIAKDWVETQIQKKKLSGAGV